MVAGNQQTTHVSRAAEAMTLLTLDDRYQVLARSVFRVLPERDLRLLAEETYEIRRRAGHLHYEPEVSVVASGLMRAFIEDEEAHQVTVAYPRPADTLAHLAGRRYPTAFQAVTDSHLLVVGNDRALGLQQVHPALGWESAKELSERLDDLHTDLGYFAFGHVVERLAFHLLTLTADDGAEHPLHLAELAIAIGSPREVVSRELHDLADHGILHIDHEGITVVDRARLAEVARME